MKVVKILSGVELRGIQPEMSRVGPIVLEAFAEEGLDCYLTSAVRPGDNSSLHGFGYAEDYDCSSKIGEDVGIRVELRVKSALGPQFFVWWHKGRSGKWHLHVEFDPGNRGVAPYLKA